MGERATSLLSVLFFFRKWTLYMQPFLLITFLNPVICSTVIKLVLYIYVLYMCYTYLCYKLYIPLDILNRLCHKVFCCTWTFFNSIMNYLSTKPLFISRTCGHLYYESKTCPCVTLMSFWRCQQQTIKFRFHCHFLTSIHRMFSILTPSNTRKKNANL